MLPDPSRLRALGQGDPLLAEVCHHCDRMRMREGTVALLRVAGEIAGGRTGGVNRRDLVRVFRMLEITGFGRLFDQNVRRRARFV